MEELGIYYFHQGTNYETYKLLGAHYTKESTTFRVWAPNAKAVYVVGDFNDWQKALMKRISSNGIYEITITGVLEFQNYRYVIETFNNKFIEKSDPYGFHFELRPKTSSKVYNLNGYTYNDGVWMKKRKNLQKPNQPLNIYEVHLGSWRKFNDGEFFSYQKIAHELASYVKKLHYTHIEVMPLCEYPYDPSWGYQVLGYYAITSRYGTPKDFMEFVDIMHQNNIGVIMDWVPGHFVKDGNGLIDFDGTYLYENQDPMRMEHKGWGTRCFDYGREEIQSFLVSNAMFFFDLFHLDGLRVDAVTSMLYLDYGRDKNEWHPNNFGGNVNLEAVAFLKKLNKVKKEKFPDCLMIAEESSAFPNVTSPLEDGLGFDYKWNMGWMNDSLDYVKNDPIYRKYHHHNITFQLTYAFDERFILPISHDEVVHMKGSLINKMPGNEFQKISALKTYMTYMMTHPGKKLTFMGCEFGQFSEWNESRELDWYLLENDLHKKLLRFNSALFNIYKTKKPLHAVDDSWDGFEWIVVNDENRNVFIYKRKYRNQTIIVILNFAYATWNNYTITLESGTYSVLLNTMDKKFGGTVDSKQIHNVIDDKLSFDLLENSAIILEKEI